MAKPHRVEVRLGDGDYNALKVRAEYYGGTTRAVESLLRGLVPTRIVGVYEVGVVGRRRFSVQFSNGMVVHGFLWSRGQQLFGPRVRNGNGGWSRIVDGSRDFWYNLRHFCEENLEPEPQEEVERD